jgi:hypothetical protein
MNNLLSLFHLGYISSTEIDKVSQQGRKTLNGQSDGFGNTWPLTFLDWNRHIDKNE